MSADWVSTDWFTRPVRIEGLGFVGSPLDRADALRRDEAALDRLRADPASCWIALTALRPIVDSSNGGCDLLWLTRDEIPADAPWVFLGLRDDGRACFAATLPAGAVTRGEAMELRPAAIHMQDGRAALLAQARALFAWHERHGHCAVCGARTRSIKGGYQRGCESPVCGADHFPRTDPVVIMLVAAGDRVLLGRPARLAPGVYTTLAGFIEPGESIEEAVAREVWEEAGVRVTRVRYVASQPWPFPSTLMIGCFAEATFAELHVDTTELEHAAWFTRDDVVAALAGTGPFVVPAPIAIASTLMRTWVAATATEPDAAGSA